MDSPKTLQQAILFYADMKNCIRVMVEQRWPDGKVTCPTCGRNDVSWLEKQNKWQCKSTHAKRQFSAKVGTIFEDSPLGLDKWLMATWMITNCKNGVSSYEIARAIGVTQKSAWFMLHRIRMAMGDSEGQIGGTGSSVEMDETFIGGKVKNMHKSKRPQGDGFTGKPVGAGSKTIVVGMVERGGRVKTQVVGERNKAILADVAHSHVADGSVVMTDEWGGYNDLKFKREVINHAIEYVRGHVHTNSIENFWSCLKRSLNGTYVAVEPMHLDRYLDEQMFRFNHRHKNNDASRMAKVLSQVTGKRLTYAEVTGKVGQTAF